MFFYVVEGDQIIVGPWNDATHLKISSHYADIYDRNGNVNFEGKAYHVLRFVHTHPDNPDPSPEDIAVRDWFHQYGGENIYTEILFYGTYYRY